MAQAGVQGQAGDHAGRTRGQAILRCSKTPLAQWGKKLLARKGQINLVVAAMARKLAVAVWYLMMGRWTPLEEIDDRLVLKVGKMIRQVETKHLNQRGKARHDWRDEIYDRLKNVKVYQLDPHKKFTPASRQPVMAVAQP